MVFNQDLSHLVVNTLTCLKHPEMKGSKMGGEFTQSNQHGILFKTVLTTAVSFSLATPHQWPPPQHLRAFDFTPPGLPWPSPCRSTRGPSARSSPGPGPPPRSPPKLRGFRMGLSASVFPVARAASLTRGCFPSMVGSSGFWRCEKKRRIRVGENEGCLPLEWQSQKHG